MLRRLGFLGVLLLSLSGFVPTAWACALIEQQSDCCPPGAPPCDTQAPISASLGGPACCDAYAAPARAVASRVLQKEDSVADPPQHVHWTGIGAIQLHSDRTPRMRVSLILGPPRDQQLLYLQTGRLRL